MNIYCRISVLSALLLSAFSLFPLSVHASAVFTSGDAAINVLGINDDNLAEPAAFFGKGNPNDGYTNRLGFFHYHPKMSMAIDTVHHRFFYPDTENHRVMVYNLNSDNTLQDHVADYVLGAANFYSGLNDGNATLAVSLAYDSVHDRLFVSQIIGTRIFVFDTTTITNGESPIYVIGQPNFAGYFSPAATASGMSIAPYGLAYDSMNNRLFSADYYYNRVMVYELDAIANGMSASYVLGQPNFTSTDAATTASGFNIPLAVAVDEAHDRLFVTDMGNSRVLVFDSSALSNGMAASNVIGQVSFTGSTAGTTQSKLTTPFGVEYDVAGNRLFLADYGNNRVLEFDVSTISNGMNASKVLGQTNFTNSTAATTQAGMSGPTTATYDPTNQYLYVNELANNRVTLFDVEVISNGESAFDGLGQYDDSTTNPGFVFNKGGAANSPSQYGFSTPRGAAVDPTNHRLFVADSGNNRVLVYNLTTGNELTNRLPDYVLGQTNFHSNAAALTATGMYLPYAVAYDATRDRIFVSDHGNYRILVYSGALLSSGMSASYVIGQTNFTGGATATTQNRFSLPQGIAYDVVSDRLIVADTGNHRVEIFDGASLANGMNASVVLGQADFTHAATAATQAGMNTPTGVFYDGANARLFVADSGNNRALVFTGSTLTNGMDAGYVIGQASFTASAARTTQAGLRSPGNVTVGVGQDLLFISDSGNNRLMVFDTSSLSNGMSATAVLGQTGFTTSGAVVGQSTMSGPQQVSFDPTTNNLYIADTSFNRLLVFNGDGSNESSSSSSSSAVDTGGVGGRGGGGGRRGSPGRGSVAPLLHTTTPHGINNSAQQISTAARTRILKMRERLAERIEKRIQEQPLLAASLHRILERLDARIAARFQN